MRIVLLGFVTQLGGIRSHTQWLSRALLENDCQVMIIATGIYQEGITVEPLELPGAEILCLEPIKPGQFNSRLIKVKQFIELVAQVHRFQPDVYLCMGTGWIASLLPLAFFKQVRKIFFEVMSGEILSRTDARWGVRWWFDEVVGQSPKVAETFRRYTGWNRRLLALPAMPEPLELTASLPQAEIKRTEIGKAKAALFSRLVPHKQAFWLVQQWDQLKDIIGELHIHGSGPEELLILDYIEKNRLGDRIKCHGRYPQGQAYADMLSTYDLTLLPTVGAEGAPLVLLESMACGVPFVAYGAGGIVDYAVDNPNCIIVPLENNFITAVRQMIHQLADGQINQRKLQELYFEKYSYEALRRDWISYLCEEP